MKFAKSWECKKSQTALHGGEVARYCLDGRIKEVADYCETDIVNTYRVWLRYELFRGRLTNAELEATETALLLVISHTSDKGCYRTKLTSSLGSNLRKLHLSFDANFGQHDCNWPEKEIANCTGP